MSIKGGNILTNYKEHIKAISKLMSTPSGIMGIELTTLQRIILDIATFSQYNSKALLAFLPLGSGKSTISTIWAIYNANYLNKTLGFIAALKGHAVEMCLHTQGIAGRKLNKKAARLFNLSTITTQDILILDEFASYETLVSKKADQIYPIFKGLLDSYKGFILACNSSYGDLDKIYLPVVDIPGVTAVVAGVNNDISAYKVVTKNVPYIELDSILSNYKGIAITACKGDNMEFEVKLSRPTSWYTQRKQNDPKEFNICYMNNEIMRYFE